MFGWDFKVAKAAWTVGLVAIAFYLAYAVRKTFLIFVLALLVAYMIAPLVNLIERYKWRRVPRGASVFLAFALVIGLVGLGAMLVAPVVSSEAQKLTEQLSKLSENSQIANRIPLPGWLEQYRERIGAFVQHNVEAGAAAALPYAKDVGGRVITIAGNAIFVVLIPIVALIFVKDGPDIRDTLLRELASWKSRDRFARILADLHDALGKYVRALGLLCLATLAAYGIFFSVMGVPYGILLAAIAAILEIIPLMGPLAAAAIALFIAGVSGYEHLLWIAGFIVAYRIFQDYVLSPLLMKGNIGIHPALVIFGLLAGEQLGGVAGIFLSIPVIAALLILEKDVRSAQSRTA